MTKEIYLTKLELSNICAIVNSAEHVNVSGFVVGQIFEDTGRTSIMITDPTNTRKNIVYDVSEEE